MKVFPPFRLDVVNQCLWHGGTRLALMPKPFSFLRYLVERAGRLVLQAVRLQMAPTRGYAELMLGEPARAVGYFEEVLDRGAGRTFMLNRWSFSLRIRSKRAIRCGSRSWQHSPFRRSFGHPHLARTRLAGTHGG
jgi:hypothetical protein